MQLRLENKHMHAIQLDQHTEQALSHIAARQGLSPETLIKKALLDYLAEEQAITKAGSAYKNYLDDKEAVHDFIDVVKEFGLDD
jgi:predicted transcriptional regulator